MESRPLLRLDSILHIYHSVFKLSWKIHGKYRFFFGGNFDISTLDPDNFPGQIQSQAYTVLLGPARAVKPPEDPGNFILWNPPSMIDHVDPVKKFKSTAFQ